MPPRARPTQPPVIALVGIPNAGKSTLFNRLLGERRALVTEIPGTTRDRLYARFRAEGKACLLCDTGGVTGPRGGGGLEEEIRRQTFAALGEARVIVLVCDGRAGVTAGDQELAAHLRPVADRVIVAWNKVDDPRRTDEAAAGFSLGLGEPIPVSAEHGIGTADLVAAIAMRLPEGLKAVPPAPGEEIRVAIVGRPNVGKSSLLNRLCGAPRVAVGPIPGTTRDPIDTEITRGDRLYRFVDTAGIRRPSRASGRIERLGVMAAKRAITRADVVLVLFDAAEGLAAQDLTIAGLVEESGRGTILVANKWDLVEEREEAAKALRIDLLARLRFARFAPLVTISALEGQRVHTLYDLIDSVYAAGEVTIATPRLNRFLESIRAGGKDSGPKGPKLRYITQTGTRPPSFLIFGPDAVGIHFSEVRRIENRLRETFGIGPTPVRLRFRTEQARTERRGPRRRRSRART